MSMDRERMIRMVLTDHMGQHRDPKAATYNECEKEPCAWCDYAQKILDSAPVGPREAPEAEPEPLRLALERIAEGPYAGASRIASDVLRVAAPAAERIEPEMCVCGHPGGRHTGPDGECFNLPEVCKCRGFRAATGAEPDALLGCPFCGAEPYVTEPGFPGDGYQIGCDAACEDTGAAWQDGRTFAEARERWNRRPPALVARPGATPQAGEQS